MSFNAKCKVNSDGSVCLEDILNSFNSPIKEEHAWALCYQCVKYYNECISSRRPHIYSVHEVRHVYLKTDGNIHENTNNKVRDEARKLARGDKELIAGLGVAMYMALDRGSQKNEERVISQDLEELINYMVSDDLSHSTEQTHHETDDEGIEQDAEDVEEPGTSKTRTHTILRGVLKRCEAHLNLTKDKSEAHYKAVLRALVAEALELSMFLEKVAQGSIVLPNASSEDTVVCWTKFWDQVMMDLRMGVKLKKAPPCRAHIEYELTPYEILMKDIRTCKYSLRKIMVNGDVPSRVTKDAHAIIMEFIRSRPPLKKASERKLPAPALREFTPREQLLDSIKKGRKLRPTARKQPEPKKLDAIETGSNTKRRLIKVDVSQFDDDDDDDESDDSPDVDDGGEWSSMESLRTNALDLATSQDMHTRVSAGKSAWCKLEVYDPTAGSHSVPQSRPCSRQSCISSEAESVQLDTETARAMQEELTDAGAPAWQDTVSLDDRLSLTLAEIVHIRSVLTKAELEALPVEGRVKHDVEARKVCFLCLKTRFGIFGPWGQRCSLCKRTVCSKCYSYMSIPMEHFSSVPVVLLSPSIMATPVDSPSDSLPKTLVNKISNSGSPSLTPSPDTQRSGASLMESSTISDPGTPGRFRPRPSTSRRTMDKLKTPQIIVCHDCKLMVLQIIKSARANRAAVRNKALQSLTLNLSPVF